MKQKQKGFAVIEVAIVLVVLAAVLSIGLYVFKHHKAPKSTALSAVNSSSLEPKTSSPSQSKQSSPQPTVSTLQPAPSGAVPTHSALSTHTSSSPTPQATQVKGTVTGTFVQQENSTWPSAQTTIYIGVSADNVKNVSKVEWYLNSFSGTLLHSTTASSANDQNDNGGLYQFDWDVSGLSPGTYRVVARVYDSSGNYQIVTNNLGQPYLDTIVKM